MPIRGFRTFLDTSVLVAGIISPRGAAHEVIRMAEADIVRAVVSEQVLTELDRVLSAKFPELVQEYRGLLRNLHLEVADDPSPHQRQRLEDVIEPADAGILAAADRALVDWLLTWDKKDFLKPKVKDRVRFRIADPGEFLHAFREWALEKAG